MGNSPGIILIVEDSEPCVTTLELALEGLAALEIRTARTGAEAIALINTWNGRVRAVVTDLNLPMMDGFELIEWIRSSRPPLDMPILVTSGDSDPNNAERLRILGANAYFVKPYSPATLRRTLERLLHA